MTSLTSYNPYLAGISGKSPEEAAALESRIEALAPAVRDFLFSADLPDKLEAAMRAAALPEAYFVATSKIVFLTILGDIPATTAGELLMKLGVTNEVATTMARLLDELFQPLITARAQQSAPHQMQPLKPLTQRLGPSAPSLTPGPRPPECNILNLRENSQT